MNIFICGGSGYLGSLLANSLCKKYDIIVGTRDRKKINNYNKDIKVKQVNYYSYNSLEKSVKNIDLIIHLVGMNKADSEKKPKQSLKLKKKVTENLLKLANKNNSKIIYFSSIQVYKNFSSKKKINEKSETFNADPYSKAHLIAEKILNQNKKKINIIILRLSSVFGANIFNTSKELLFTLANNFCYQAIKNSTILIQNPNVIRNFLPYSILIRCINDLISKHKNRLLICNLGYKSLSLFELSELIIKRYKCKFKKVCSIKTNIVFNKKKKLKFESNYKTYKFNQKLFIKELDNLLEFFKKNYV
jgi:nucleoside-diphosphate-sugar epimerase